MNIWTLIGGLAGILIVAAATYGLLAWTISPESGTAEPYSWAFHDKTTDQTAPKTQVNFRQNGKSYTVGVYDGSCVEEDSDLLPDEESKVVCWLASAGKEIGLFDEGGTQSIKVGDLGEGSAQIEGFRGNFQTLLSF